MDESFRVLLADDESAVVAAVKIALRGLGCSIESACDGQAALDRITANPDRFDLLITDDYMPNLRGLDLVRRLREINFRGKIFVLSAYLSPEMKSAYGKLNVDRMIEKPFDIFELRAAVEGVAGCPSG
jgi:CheY-like chemotaxis protein